MNCLECQELLQQRLDGERVPKRLFGNETSDALEQHLNQCVACREQHAGAVLLLDGLKELTRPQPRPGFARMLAESVLEDRRQRRGKLRRRVYLTMALAASVMLILMAGYYSLPRSPGLGLNEIVKRELPRKITLPPVEPIPELHAKKVEPRSPLTPLMDRWADTTRDHARVVQVAMNFDAVENMSGVNKLPPIDPGVREASQEVSDGVRTVTRNARKAFDFFARELPMPDVSERN